jgi:hypothetical protein
MSIIDGAKLCVAAGGLRPAQAPIILSTPEAAQLVAWADTERITGLLDSAIHDGSIGLSDEHVDEVRHLHLGALRTSLAAEAAAAEAIGLLTSVGVRCTLLKGIASAHLDHDRPELRTFNDADMLLPRGTLPAAIDVLERAGYRRQQPGLAPWWEQRYARAVVMHDPDGLEVDLHTRIAAGYFGERLHAESLFTSTVAIIDLGGHRFEALPDASRLLSSCFAAVLSRGTHVRLLRDIAQQLLVTGCDWRDAASIATDVDSDAVLAQGLLRAERALGLDPHEAFEWARGVVPSARAARALHLSVTGESEGFRADARSTLLALGPIDRARYLAGLALPPRANRHARGLGFGHRMRSARSLATSTVSRRRAG